MKKASSAMLKDSFPGTQRKDSWIVCCGDLLGGSLCKNGDVDFPIDFMSTCEALCVAEIYCVVRFVRMRMWIFQSILWAGQSETQLSNCCGSKIQFSDASFLASKHRERNSCRMSKGCTVCCFYRD